MPEPQRELPMKGDLDYVSPEEQSRRRAEEQFEQYKGQAGPPPSVTNAPEIHHPETQAPAPKPTTARTPARGGPAATKPINDQALLEEVIDNTTFEYKDFGTNDLIRISFREAYNFIAKPTAKGAKPPKRLVFLHMQFCKMRHLNPYTGDVHFVGYDGKDGPSWSTQVAHQAVLKRAEANSHYDGKRSGIVVQFEGEKDLSYLSGAILPPGARLVGGWCEVHRKDRSHTEYQTTQLRSYDKGYGYWKTDPEWMITKCAEAKALRGAFPNDLGGMYTEEEGGAQMLADGDGEAAAVEPKGKGRLRRLPDAAPSETPA